MLCRPIELVAPDRIPPFEGFADGTLLLIGVAPEENSRKKDSSHRKDHCGIFPKCAPVRNKGERLAERLPKPAAGVFIRVCGGDSAGHSRAVQLDLVERGHLDWEGRFSRCIPTAHELGNVVPARKYNLELMVLRVALVEHLQFLPQRTGGHTNDRVGMRIEVGLLAAESLDGNRGFANVLRITVEIFVADEGEETNEACGTTDLRMGKHPFQFLLLC